MRHPWTATASLTVLVPAALVLLCLGVTAQADYVWDANTVVLDHLDGSTSGTSYGTLNYTSGVMGQAGQFNSNNYIKYQSEWSGAAGTIEMWVYLRHPGESHLMRLQWLDSPTPPGSGHVGGLQVDGEGKLYFWAWPSGTITSNSTVPLNRWTHLAATWGTGMKLYINGALDQQTADDAYAQNPLWAYMPYWGAGLDGPDIDEVRISNIARDSFNTDIPEPGSLGMLAAFAIPGLLLWRKRRKAG